VTFTSSDIDQRPAFQQHLFPLLAFSSITPQGDRMFSNWQQEKAIAALVDQAQAMADKLGTAKPHVVDSHAATAMFWAASYLANGQNLHDLMGWKAAVAARFATAADTKIAALRKQRAYDSSDGLAIWMHTARAVSKPRIAPPVHQIWLHLSKAGPNAVAMADDLLQDAGLPVGAAFSIPKGFQSQD
jgi:hypothetical protein